MQCIAGLLVPPELATTLTQDQLRELRRAIRYSIEVGGSFCTLQPNFDWREAKLRVNEVLAPYGLKLAETER